MKHYHDYKKLFKSAILVIGFLIPFVFSYAQSVQDVQNNISQKNADIAALEKEIADYQNQLNSIGEQKNSLSSSLKQLDITRKKLNADIAVTEKKIDITNLKIENLSSDISDKENVIKTDLDSISLEIKNVNELEKSSLLEKMLSQDNFTVAWNDIDNILSLRDTLRGNISKLREARSALLDTRATTINAKNELVKLKDQLSDQRKIVLQNTKEKNDLLKQTKNSEANYQKLLKDRIAKRDAFEKELQDYEAQLQFILDPSKLPPGRVLSWPLSDIFVTQLFGKTVDSKRLYASGTHNGVDFRASVGTPVFAMADGTILGTGDTDIVCQGASFGKFVFIQYNNGLSSTFGHLSLIKAYEGQQVRRGDIVGYSGNTGHSTGPHLHVSLYASQAAKMTTKQSIACGGGIYRVPVAPINAYLDPLFYLPFYSAGAGSGNATD